MRRLDALGLTEAQIDAATAALDAVLRADAALDRPAPAAPRWSWACCPSTTRRTPWGSPSPCCWPAALCLLVAALAWLALEPSRRGPLPADGAAVARETEADQTAEGALAEMGRNQALR